MDCKVNIHVFLVENLVVLGGDCEENNCVDDFEEYVNLVENDVVIRGDTEENSAVDEIALLESLVDHEGDTEENRGLDDLEEVNFVEKSVDVVLDGDIEENN